MSVFCSGISCNAKNELNCQFEEISSQFRATYRKKFMGIETDTSRIYEKILNQIPSLSFQNENKQARLLA